MVEKEKLKGAFVSAGYTVATAADALGIPRSTMYAKLQTGMFTVPEIDDMIVTFRITHWDEIFQLGVRKGSSTWKR